MKHMKGQKFSINIAGETHKLWHGFDKTPSEQLVNRRSAVLHAALRKFGIESNLAQDSQTFTWWKENFLDADFESGTMCIKIAPSAAQSKVTHDISKKDNAGLIVARRAEIDKVRLALTATVNQTAADRFNTIVLSAIAEANTLTARNGDEE